MSRLSKQLSDAAKSGVYRASHGRDIAEAARASKLSLACIDLSGATGKDALIERFARALEFPAWFGGNWDALEDCLTDLSWSGAGGHVLLIEGAAASDERGILADILRSAATFWAERSAGEKRPFFAVFIGAAPDDLPPLDRERQ